MSDLSSERFSLPRAIPDQVRDDGERAVPPIPLHHNHFAPERQVAFLEQLALWGNARAACRNASVAPQTVYRHRRASHDFALAWDAALLVARPQVEDVLADRALNGIEEVVFYHGEEIARRRRYDSRLLLAHLARLDRAEESNDILDVAHDFDAALERLKRGEPVDPGAGGGGGDDEDDTATYGERWEDERLPFVERAYLYQQWLEADDEGAEDEDELRDPCEPDDDSALATTADLGEIVPQDRVTPVTLLDPEADPPCDAQRHGEVAEAARRPTEGQGAGGPSTTTPAASRSPSPSQVDGEDIPEPASAAPAIARAPAPPRKVPVEQVMAEEYKALNPWRPWKPIMDGRCSRYVGA